MSDTDLYNEINNEFVDASNKLLKKLIIKRQTKHQLENYSNAKSDTSMTCVICGGTYTPRNRFIHNRTKRHIKSIDNIKNYIYS
jgi:hypothetical protein